MSIDKLKYNGTGINHFLSNVIKTFGSILNELDSISSISEKEFTKISETLQSYYSASRNISDKASETIQVLTGDEFNKDSEKLKSIFDVIFNSINNSQNKFDRSETFFSELIHLINEIKEDVSGFKRLVKYLRVQGISTKIESSRLGSDDKGFKNLADNVDNLSINISDKSGKFHLETESLINLIKNVQSDEIKLKKEQQDYSRSILKSSEASLDLLFNKNRESSSKYEIVFSNFQEIQKNIGTVVTSVQFHDITRQQIQHVYRTFEDLIKKITLEGKSANFNPERILNTVYDISKIQYEQLKHSRDELYKATNDIISNLTGISENIRNMTKEISELLNDNDNDKHSFINDIQEGIKTVSASLNENENLGISFSGSINNVNKTINSLANFINEIGEIGSEIELISLNANIKAVHIGREGAALAVIAEEIQKLSIDARKQTEAVVLKIIKINEFSKSFQNSFESIGHSDGTKKILKEFDNVLNSLNELIKQAASGLAVIQVSAEKLQKNLNETIKNITVHKESEKTINKILKNLELIMKEGKSSAGKNLHDTAELERLSENYTMQSQRDIHNNVTSSIKGSSFRTENTPLNNDPGEFGDNVELF